MLIEWQAILVHAAVCETDSSSAIKSEDGRPEQASQGPLEQKESRARVSSTGKENWFLSKHCKRRCQPRVLSW